MKKYYRRLKLITQEDVAKAAGLNRSSISRILNNDPRALAFSEQTRRRVRRIAAEMNYRPNLLASNLRKQENKIILCLVGAACRHSDILHLKALERAFGNRNYNLVVQFLVDLPDDVKIEFFKKLVNWPAGIVVWSLGIKDDSKCAQTHLLFRNAPPSISMTTPMAGTMVDYIKVDWTAPKQELVDYLLKKKIRSLACCVDDMDLKADVCGKFIEKIKSYGIQCDVFSAPRRSVGCSYFKTGRKIAKDILGSDKLPDAVYCISDELAFSMIEVFKKKGVRVPEDILLIGGGDSEFCKWLNNPLPVMIHDIEGLAETAAADLVLRIERGDRSVGTGRMVAEFGQSLEKLPPRK